MKIFLIIGSCFSLLLLAGWFFVQKKIDQFAAMNEINFAYEKLPISEGKQANPIIIIPGYLGSRLEHAGDMPIAWGAFTKESVDPSKPEGARKIALPINPDIPIAELKDEVFSTSILDTVEVKISGFRTEQPIYKHLLSALNSRNSSSKKERFEFHYDWRKDNVVIAQQLHEFIQKKKTEIEADRKQQYGEDAEPVKFDIVAHSMGGLIARYYIRYGDQDLENAEVNWAGTEMVDRLLMIAPPNLGSLKSVLGANDGYQGHPMLPKYSGAILSTFPSTYQLFPRDRHEKVVNNEGEPISIYDAKLWKRKKWGFFNPQNSKILAALLPGENETQRETKALHFLENCLARADKFHAALDCQAEQPEGLEIYLFSGDSIATPAKLAARSQDEGNQSFEVVDWSPGDDTVTRRSSLSDEHARDDSPIDFTGAYFVSADHFGLTSNGAIFEGLMHILVKKPNSVQY